jgi:hypothetical protein
MSTGLMDPAELVFWALRLPLALASTMKPPPRLHTRTLADASKTMQELLILNNLIIFVFSVVSFEEFA